MTYKVVLKNDIVVAFGPNDGNYDPFIKEDEILEIWDNSPTQEQIDEGITLIINGE